MTRGSLSSESSRKKSKKRYSQPLITHHQQTGGDKKPNVDSLALFGNQPYIDQAKDVIEQKILQETGKISNKLIESGIFNKSIFRKSIIRDFNVASFVKDFVENMKVVPLHTYVIQDKHYMVSYIEQYLKNYEFNKSNPNYTLENEFDIIINSIFTTTGEDATKQNGETSEGEGKGLEEAEATATDKKNAAIKAADATATDKKNASTEATAEAAAETAASGTTALEAAAEANANKQAGAATQPKKTTDKTTAVEKAKEYFNNKFLPIVRTNYSLGEKKEILRGTTINVGNLENLKEKYQLLYDTIYNNIYAFQLLTKIENKI